METKSHQLQNFDSTQNILDSLAFVKVFCDNFSDDKLLAVIEGVAKPVSEAILISQSAGLSKRQQEALYIKAYRFYQNENYEDAVKIFLTLLREDKTEARFYKGMASCLQMLQDYEKAVSHYAFGYVLDQSDPMPLFYVGQCLGADNKPDEAIGAFEEFIDEAKTNPSLHSMRQQAIDLIAALTEVAHLENAL